MRVLCRLFYYACAGLMFVAVVALFALIGYVFFYIFPASLVGRIAAVLIGFVYLGVCGAAVYLARRRSRGKTEDELYSMGMLRSLSRIQDLRWPWSIYGLGPGQDDRTERRHEDPTAGPDRAG